MNHFRLPHWMRRRAMHVETHEYREGDVLVRTHLYWYLSRFRKRIVFDSVSTDLDHRDVRWPR